MMRILLIGEYSNVHATLARGLRSLGHEVIVASNGDYWKDYPRDIDLARPRGRWGGMELAARVYANLHSMRGFDIVQLINPMFMELKAERLVPIYDYLRRHNGRVVMGAFGMDYYWVNECCTRMPLRYSDFNIGKHLRTNADAIRERAEWTGTPKQRLNERVASTADKIVAGLYEYWACYQPNFPDKTVFIPFPVDMGDDDPAVTATSLPVKLFIGINKERSEYKGTDIMLAAALDVERKYPERVRVVKAESVPFSEYRHLMDGSDLLLDQLYSYTPAMNALLAMSKGIVCVGGGEPENYEIIGEESLRPIINVEPSYQSVYDALERVALNPSRLDTMKSESVEYVRRHHHYIKVARQYEALYNSIL